MASAEKIGKLIMAIKTVYPYYSNEGDSETLAKTWMHLLKDLPDGVVTEALTRCLKTCKTPPTPADLLEQVAEITAEEQPSNEELWVTLTDAVKKTQDLAFNFNHTFIEDNGKSQGENAREKFHDLWESLPENMRAYLGGKSELLRLSRYNEEELYFEKKQFLREIPKISQKLLSASLPSGNARLKEEDKG